MDFKHPNEYQPYPTISGNPSTDRALCRLSNVLLEIAKTTITRAIPTIEATYEKRASRDRNTQTLDGIVESERLLFKPSEVAGMLGIGRSKVYEMLQTGEIPSLRIGKAIRVSRKALEKWVAEH